jgi:hypothetical protein
VLPFAVNHEDAALSARALFAEEALQGVLRLFGAKSVQIEARVDRQEPAPEFAEYIGRYPRPTPFDALSIVFHLEATPLHEGAQVRMDRRFFFARGRRGQGSPGVDPARR